MQDVLVYFVISSGITCCLHGFHFTRYSSVDAINVTWKKWNRHWICGIFIM